MPKMPDFTDIPRTKPTTGDISRPARDFAGEAVGRLGDTLQREAAADQQLNLQIHRKNKSESDTLEFTRAKADWNIRRLNEEDGYQFDTNPKIDKWEAGYSKNIGKHKAAAASIISDPKLRLRFEAEADTDIAEGTLRIRGRARDLVNNQKKASGLQAIEDTLILATRPNLPQDEVNKLFGRARADIDNMVAAGIMTPEAAVEARRKFSERFATAKVKEDIQTDPETAYRHLQGGAAGDVFYSKLRSRESSGSDTAASNSSSALGRYGFTVGTWADVMKAHPELGLSKDGRTNGDQQERAIRAFTRDNAAVLDQNGFKASEANLALAHFFGAQGAVNALKADPNANAAELFPEAAKANPTIFYAGGGKTERPRTVAEVIALQSKGFTGDAGPAPTYYQFVSPEERTAYSAAAEAEYSSRLKADRDAKNLATYQMKSTLENDISQIRETGKPSDVDPQMVVSTLGTDDAAKWLDDRKAAAKTYAAVTAMDTMTNDEIDSHLQELEPVAGDPSFSDAEKTYRAAEAKAKKLVDMRLKDPAKSVDSSPLVREALKSFDSGNPQTVQELVKARLAAQEQVGIVKAMRQPITRGEAKQIIAPIERIIDMTDAEIVAATGSAGADKAARKASIKEVNRQAEEQIRATVDQIEATYGPYADQVLAFSIAESVRDKDIGNLATRVFKKIAAGERVTISDGAGLEAAQDAGTADRAMAGTPAKPQGSPQIDGTTPRPQPTGQPKDAKGAQASPQGMTGAGRGTAARRMQEGQKSQPRRPAEKAGYPWPSRVDVQKLLKNPALAPQFDKMYGQGRANEWLPQE